MESVFLRMGSRELQISATPLVMGIVNVTPDSFSDGGNFFDPSRAIAHAEMLVEEGADLIDVGGESTRPGAAPVPLDEELRRVLPVIKHLAQRITVPISVDTYKPAVAEQAIEHGAAMINDVTGFREPAMIRLAAKTEAACVVMHMKGTPQTMQSLAEYVDVVEELRGYFEARIRELVDANVSPDRIVLDPGIGFAKKRVHNLSILRRLGEWKSLGRPILIGASRKSILGQVTGRRESDRLYSSLAVAVSAYEHGARIFRVHDVRATKDALAMSAAIADDSKE